LSSPEIKRAVRPGVAAKENLQEKIVGDKRLWIKGYKLS
jgi:hypothetical protein